MYASGFNTDSNVIKLLIEHGADINAGDKNGKTAYDIAAGNTAINDNPEILALLKG